MAVDPRLARDGYSAQEVDYWLRRSRTHGVRLDLLDPVPDNAEELAGLTSGQYNKVGELETVLKGSGNAVVEFNTTNKLGGGLRLKMRPDERLREAMLKYLVMPWYRVKIPNGHVFEFPQGAYVWDVPERDVDPGNELWDVNLNDLTHFLDTESPVFGGFNMPDGMRDTDGVKVALALAGIFNFSGVVDSEHVLQGAASWGPNRIDFTNGDYGTFFYINNDSDRERSSFRTTTLLDIEGDLHAGIAYLPPHQNRSGVYQCRPAPNIRSVTPVMTFGTAADSLTFHDVKTKASDKNKIANLIYVYTENPEGSTFIGIASADLSYPGHPWSAAKCGHVLTRTIPSANATSPENANAIAQQELALALSYTRRVTWTQIAHPTLEPYDVAEAYIKSDAEFDTPTPLLMESSSFDLYEGKQTCGARSIFQPVETGLVVDTGLEHVERGKLGQ